MHTHRRAKLGPMADQHGQGSMGKHGEPRRGEKVGLIIFYRIMQPHTRAQEGKGVKQRSSLDVIGLPAE